MHQRVLLLNSNQLTIHTIEFIKSEMRLLLRHMDTTNDDLDDRHDSTEILSSLKDCNPQEHAIRLCHKTAATRHRASEEESAWGVR